MSIKHNFKRKRFQGKKTVVDDITFASQTEARYFCKLKALRETGELLFFIRQPKFDLPGGTTYTADFMEFYEDGTARVVDVKSNYTAKDPKFLRSKKQTESLYSIEIEIVTKV